MRRHKPALKTVAKTPAWVEFEAKAEPWDVFVFDPTLPYDIRHINPRPSVGLPLRDTKAEIAITRALTSLRSSSRPHPLFDLTGTYSRWIFRDSTTSDEKQQRQIEILYVSSGKQRRGIFTWTFAHIMSEMKRLKLWSRVVVCNVQNRALAQHLCSDRYRNRSPIIARQSISFSVE
jgi:hypothetical protein